jgi:pimeloyl-ACP methyl ester carboxylesterase
MATLRATGATEVQDVFVRMPQTFVAGQPLQALVALHGMGGNGYDFGSALAAQADAHGWLIVAPTIKYGDWTNPEQIAREEPALIAWLSDYLATLGQGTGLTIQPRVVLFGHSRGAQLALRFTEIHPDQVAAVAAVSAGTYTLPLTTDVQTGQTLEYPFGIANLAQADGGQPFDVVRFDAVPIWIGVGGADSNTADVPSAWTPFIGSNRVNRAQRFAQTLQEVGAAVSLRIFPNLDHSLTDDMRNAGCDALAAALALTQA